MWQQNHFKLAEFYKEEFTPTPEIIDKIRYHIAILNPVRDNLGDKVIISQHSGWRPELYELSKGRSGRSEHCFKGPGAVDVTCTPRLLPKLLKLLIKSQYTRICYYPTKGFIHCDLKFEPINKQTFICRHNTWEAHGLQEFI